MGAGVASSPISFYSGGAPLVGVQPAGAPAGAGRAPADTAGQVGGDHSNPGVDGGQVALPGQPAEVAGGEFPDRVHRGGGDPGDGAAGAAHRRGAVGTELEGGFGQVTGDERGLRAEPAADERAAGAEAVQPAAGL